MPRAPRSGGRFDQPFSTYYDRPLRRWRVMGPGFVYPPVFRTQADAAVYAIRARAADGHLADQSMLVSRLTHEEMVAAQGQAGCGNCTCGDCVSDRENAVAARRGNPGRKKRNSYTYINGEDD